MIPRISDSIVRLGGVGAAGVVYLATCGDDHTVAVKVFRRLSRSARQAVGEVGMYEYIHSFSDPRHA